ncbi:helix-turn-helix domain-containing protein [Streptomyces sp. NPDC090106]|uniref:helix-turn-helix domain-containing protein n=1 Tax=Streptomyces sp. NPDC090106 TaxID=3365946 RepID=UPI0038127C53
MAGWHLRQRDQVKRADTAVCRSGVDNCQQVPDLSHCERGQADCVVSAALINRRGGQGGEESVREHGQRDVPIPARTAAHPYPSRPHCPVAAWKHASIAQREPATLTSLSTVGQAWGDLGRTLEPAAGQYPPLVRGRVGVENDSDGQLRRGPGAAHGLSHTSAALKDLPVMITDPAAPAQEPFDFEFLCGVYRLEHAQTPHYFRALPDLITLIPDYDRLLQLRALFELLSADTAEAHLGTAATLPALLDLILVHSLRQWANEQHDPTGWPQTDDSQIAAALREMHTRPQAPWTVQRLSQVAELPRAVFTRRFTAAVGKPPMSYLIGWRLSLGARLLRETDATLASIAREVGYSTEFAFSGAFTRAYGTPPGRFRRIPTTVHLPSLTTPGP